MHNISDYEIENLMFYACLKEGLKKLRLNGYKNRPATRDTNL